MMRDFDNISGSLHTLHNPVHSNGLIRSDEVREEVAKEIEIVCREEAARRAKFYAIHKE